MYPFIHAKSAAMDAYPPRTSKIVPAPIAAFKVSCDCDFGVGLDASSKMGRVRNPAAANAAANKRVRRSISNANILKFPF